MSLRLISLNVKGIRDHKKRSSIFHWIVMQNADICLLQETHCCSDEDVEEWTKDWRGKAYWSKGTNRSRGVAILFKHNLDIEIKNIVSDNEGRYLSMAVKIDELNMHLVNIYAPNIVNERIQFIKWLDRKLTDLKNLDQNAELMVGGDFNCAMNYKCDRRYQNKNALKVDDASSKDFKDLMNVHNLEDIWRRRNPQNKRYTYFKPNSKSASRIDFWLTEKTLDPLITKITIDQAIQTDHASIQCCINTSLQDRGPGYWKLSKTVLESELFKSTLEAFWTGWKDKIHDYASKCEWWEITKYKIRLIGIAVGKKLAKERHITESKLKIRLETLKNESEPDIKQITELEKQLNNLWVKKADGARLRAKVETYEKGEKSTKYFYNLEKTKGRNKLWVQIKDSDGIIKHGLDNIMQEQVKFYSKLLKSEGWDALEAQKLLDNIDKHLSVEEKNSCDKQIEEQEVKKVIQSLKIDKSPGEDGLIAEFYKKFWDLIKGEFMQVIREIEEQNTLCDSMYRGIIALLFKCGDRDDILNWRPITLLNLDYKIIAKVYAERLKKVLPSIISNDQKACIEGRQITDTIRLIQDVIDQTDEEDMGGAIIFLDQQKAFDRVEWGYVNACLEKFGFGNTFCKRFQMLYKNAKSCINTNGHLTEYFPVSRSMRQGCPIAAFLYILQSEPMAQTFRKSDEIEGIKLNPGENESEVRVASFADDTQLFHRSEKSIKSGFNILKTYGKASGAKLNMKKTKGLYIGRWKHKEPVFKEIKWQENVGGLGCEFGYNINYEELWMKKFTKFKNKIKNWANRDLTLFGKKLLINSYIMSSIAYLAEIYTAHIPEKFITETNALIREFLWQGKIWKVAQKTMALRKEHGGLEIPDIHTFLQSRKIKWMIRITANPKLRWNTIGKKYLKKLDIKYGIEYFVTKCSSVNGDYLRNIPEFYRTCVTAWAEMSRKNKVETIDDVLQQYLFGNNEIKKNGQPLWWNHWTTQNLRKVGDIWDLENDRWVPGRTIFDRLVRKTNWIAEFESIKRAIPKKWTNILHEAIEIDNSTYIQNSKTTKITDDRITINNSDVEFRKVKTKEIYFHCLYPIKKPKCIEAWENILHCEIIWDDICKIMNKSIQGNKQKQLHWKMIHRALYSEVRLAKMGKSNGICQLCNVTEETISHMFFYCIKVTAIWNKVQNLIREVVKKNVILSFENVLFGVNDKGIKALNYIVNMIIYESKWQIWKNRNAVKYGHKVCLNEENLYQNIENGYKLQYKLFREAQHGEVIKEKIDQITDILDEKA